MPDSRDGLLTVDPVIEAVLHASRALVAVAARSLAGAGEDVTLPQYRALVVLAARGPQSMAALASALAVNPSTATRMCDRLVRKGLVRRRASPSDRRQVRLAMTVAGRRLVDDVTERRRAEIARIVGAIPPPLQAQVVGALDAFATAAGELTDQDWAAGWAI
ncbi:MAG: MarR family winged helix-turn-helix transcriptional regulator [Acidimicrobiales bacterium]